MSAYRFEPAPVFDDRRHPFKVTRVVCNKTGFQTITEGEDVREPYREVIRERVLEAWAQAKGDRLTLKRLGACADKGHYRDAERYQYEPESYSGTQARKWLNSPDSMPLEAARLLCEKAGCSLDYLRGLTNEREGEALPSARDFGDLYALLSYEDKKRAWDALETIALAAMTRRKNK